MLAIGWILKCRYKRAQQLKAFGHNEHRSSYAFKPDAFKDVKYEMEMERVASGSSNAHNIADANSMAIKSPHSQIKSPQSITHLSSKYIGSPKSMEICHTLDPIDTVSDIDNAQNQIDGVIETGNDYNIFLKMLANKKSNRSLVPRPQPPISLQNHSSQMQPVHNMNMRGYNMPNMPGYYPQNIGYAQPQQTRSYMMPRPAFYVPVSSPPQNTNLRVIQQNEQVIEEEEMQCLKVGKNDGVSSGESSVENEEVKEMENETIGFIGDKCANNNEWMSKVKISQTMDVNEEAKSELSDCTESTAWNTNR